MSLLRSEDTRTFLFSFLYGRCPVCVCLNFFIYKLGPISLKPNAESPSCWWSAAWHRMGFACWICWADWAYLEVRCAWKGLWCNKDWEEEAAYCHQLKAIGGETNKKKKGNQQSPKGVERKVCVLREGKKIDKRILYKLKKKSKIDSKHWIFRKNLWTKFWGEGS